MLESWTNQQLLKAFNIMTTNFSTTWKAAIFTDGLDEYQGGHNNRANLIEFVKTLSQNLNFKICVSSRPWVAFKDAFEQGPSLQLHLLTRRDIKDYVDDKLITKVSLSISNVETPEKTS